MGLKSSRGLDVARCLGMVFNIDMLITCRVLVVELLLEKRNLLEIDDNFVRYINMCFDLKMEMKSYTDLCGFLSSAKIQIGFVSMPMGMYVQEATENFGSYCRHFLCVQDTHH